ncbi:UNVERIFIED_ORG: hypothetical protein E4P37_13895 [Bacillus sp. AZ43]
MTTAADDPAVEEAFEAYLAGRPVPEQGAALAAFAEAVRADATRPGRPDAALAELLATGRLTDQPSPSTRTAPSAGSPPSRRPARNRRRLAMILPALLAKFLSAGAVAQAATGAGVVLVAVTGAGAAGALPGPVQDTVATAVETVTPFELPGGDEVPVDEPAPEESEPEEQVEETPVDAAAPTTFDAEVWLLGPQEAESFGGWVSQAAGNQEFKAALKAEGLSFGQVVRTHAHRKGMDDAELESQLAAEGIDVAELAPDAPEAAPPVEEPQPQVSPAPAGKGNGKATPSGGKTGDGKGAGAHGKGAGQGNGRD